MTTEELTIKYVELDKRVTRHTEQIKTAFNQIGEAKNIAESVHRLATTVELLVHEQKDTNEKIGKLTVDVEGIKEKPSKRWDTFVTVTITVIVTALLTFALTQIGIR